MEVDREWQTEREYRNDPQQKVKVVYRDAPQTAKREEKDPDAMDVDALGMRQNTRGGSHGKSTGHGCWNCGKAGHRAADCKQGSSEGHRKKSSKSKGKQRKTYKTYKKGKKRYLKNQDIEEDSSESDEDNDSESEEDSASDTLVPTLHVLFMRPHTHEASSTSATSQISSAEIRDELISWIAEEALGGDREAAEWVLLVSVGRV